MRGDYPIVIIMNGESEYPEDVPREIWLEILSKLHIRDLLKCRSVCKSWKHIVMQLRKKIVSLPLCGLLLMPPLGTNPLALTYLSVTTKEIISLPRSELNSLYITDGNLSLDFSALYTNTKDLYSIPPLFAMHRGLILRVSIRGTCIVSNPATKQDFVLRKSPIVNNFDDGERTAMVIRLFASPVAQISHFAVVRLSRLRKVIEIYYSRTQRWALYKLELDNELMEASWYPGNYVALRTVRNVFLFFLTDKDRGVVVKIKSPNNRPKTCAYGFRLPEIVNDGYKNARLGDCGGCLHLSYYNELGVWIWKHNVGSASDSWVLIFEASNARQLCKPVARGHIAKSLVAGNSVIPMAFHPDCAIVFLRINNFIFAYDLTNDIIDKIADVNDQVSKDSTFALPYLPCLDSFYALKQRIRRNRSREYEKRGDLSWNAQMGPILTSVLHEQLNWNPKAYQAVVDEIKSKLGLLITVKHYGVVMNIRTTTKFKWNEEKKMVVITLEDLQDWMEYCEGNRVSGWYMNKAIENWDDICGLFDPSI